MTARPTIDYELLAQEAMRGVVRTVLQRAAKSGLPGDHHFYISFDTDAPGVTLSKRLREKYPREMTIVLQHRFWDLSVSDDRFEVKLTFDGIPERLVVPFMAIKVFFDPSVRYGLQFEDPNLGPDAGSHTLPSGALGANGPATTRTSSQRKPRARRPRTDRDEIEISPRPQVVPSGSPVAAHAGENSSEPVAASSAASPQDSEDAAPAAKPAGAEIVSLDKFRKK